MRSSGDTVSVTVVIPTRDRPEFAARAVASALGQRDVTVEVIVIDDGGREPLISRLPLVDGRLRVLRNDRREGVAAARNRGIAESCAPWIAFLDDDDVWAPDKLRRQLDAVHAHDALWCITAAVNVDIRSVAQSISLCGPDAATVLARLCTYNAVPGGGSGVLVARPLVEQAGTFDESLSMVADWEMWHRLAHITACAIVSEPLVGYLKHDGSMTATFLDHEAEMMRLDSAAVMYCDAPVVERRLVYLEWIADQTASHNRCRAGRLKFRVAVKRRSMRTLLMAVRYFVVPSHVQLRRVFFRTGASTVAFPTPPWVQSQHFQLEGRTGIPTGKK